MTQTTPQEPGGTSRRPACSCLESRHLGWVMASPRCSEGPLQAHSPHRCLGQCVQTFCFPSEPNSSQGTTPWVQVAMLRDFLFVTLVDPVGGDPPLQLST